jgi:hypothetical protein
VCGPKGSVQQVLRIVHGDRLDAVDWIRKPVGDDVEALKEDAKDLIRNEKRAWVLRATSMVSGEQRF